MRCNEQWLSRLLRKSFYFNIEIHMPFCDLILTLQQQLKNYFKNWHFAISQTTSHSINLIQVNPKPSISIQVNPPHAVYAVLLSHSIQSNHIFFIACQPVSRKAPGEPSAGARIKGPQGPEILVLLNWQDVSIGCGGQVGEGGFP